MTGAQHRLYQAALRIGQAFGTGGRYWTPIVGSSNGTVLTVGAILTMYVVENNLVRFADSLPGPAIYAAPWWGIGMADVAPETVIIGDGAAFVAMGVADTSQGFRLTPLRPAVNPLRPAPLRLTQQGARLGLRQGL